MSPLLLDDSTDGSKKGGMRRLSVYIVLLVALILLSFALPATASAADGQTNASGDITALRSEVATLKAENEALRKENQSLRRALAARPEYTTNSAAATSRVPATVAPTRQQTDYWLTISSGIRHNSSCRYYMNSKGRFCGPNEGRACKLCGG